MQREEALIESQYAGCAAYDEWWCAAAAEYKACRALAIQDHTELTAHAVDVAPLPRMHFKGFGGMQHSAIYHPGMQVGDVYQLAVARSLPADIMARLRFRWPQLSFSQLRLSFSQPSLSFSKRWPIFS